MSSMAATVSADTSPEANAWFQSAPPLPPQIERVGAELVSRLQRALIAHEHSRGDDSAAYVAAGSTLNTARDDRIRDDIRRTIRGVFPTTVPTPSLSLQPLQEWEGYVTQINGDTFSGRLVDITAASKIEEEAADFPISDLSEDDLKLLTVGAIFRWVIGHQRSSGGTKRRVSQITFRRLPAWTRKDLKQARARAAAILEQIKWE